MTLTLTKNEQRFGWLFLLCEFLLVPFAVSIVCMLMGIYSEAAINVICFFLNAALAVLIFRRLLVRSFRNCAGRWRQTLMTALKGFGMYWIVNIAVTWLTLLVEPDFGNVNDANISSMIGESPVRVSRPATAAIKPTLRRSIARAMPYSGKSAHFIMLFSNEKSCPLKSQSRKPGR